MEFTLNQGGDVAWTKPPRGRIKANVDAAIFKTQWSIGVGCVIRDSSGNMVMAGSKNIMGAYPLREAKELSLKEALSLLKLKKVNNCIVETDSLLVTGRKRGV